MTIGNPEFICDGIVLLLSLLLIISPWLLLRREPKHPVISKDDRWVDIDIDIDIKIKEQFEILRLKQESLSVGNPENLDRRITATQETTIELVLSVGELEAKVAKLVLVNLNLQSRLEKLEDENLPA